MDWKKVFGKFAKHALISIPVGLVPILYQAEGLSTVDWDRAALALVVAVLGGGALGGGANAVKHAGKARGTAR